MIFILHAGWVRSINDGDYHWVSAEDLRSCYRLSRAESIDVRDYRESRDGPGISLHPRVLGDYAEHLSSLIKEQP